MDRKQIIQEFKLAIALVKGANRKTIRVSDLETFLDEIELNIESKGGITEDELRAGLTELTAEDQRNIAEYNALVSGHVEMFRSAIALGQSAIRNIIIINGGACVAVLAIVSNLFEKNESFARSLAVALICFGSGVLSGGLSAGVTYLTQSAYNTDRKNLGYFLNRVGIILGLAGYVFFAAGGYSIYCLLK